ncbi:MAG: hypothetical protein AAFR16_13380 [Pseudomonadota bacterium]
MEATGETAVAAPRARGSSRPAKHGGGGFPGGSEALAKPVARSAALAPSQAEAKPVATRAAEPPCSAPSA